MHSRVATQSICNILQYDSYDSLISYFDEVWKANLESLGTNYFEMRGFFCGSLNPCTCQAAPALNVWLVQHLMLRRNCLHSSICHNHGIFCTISVTMVFTYLQLAAWKHKLQAKGSFDSRTKNTKQALGFWPWNWSCASWECESHHQAIYTSSTAQGGGGSFKNRKRIGEWRMSEQKHWPTD